jgi:hypothetical protein
MKKTLAALMLLLSLTAIASKNGVVQNGVI